MIADFLAPNHDNNSYGSGGADSRHGEGPKGAEDHGAWSRLRGSSSSLLVIASPAYVGAMADDLQGAARKLCRPERLAIVSSVKGFPDELRDHLVRSRSESLLGRCVGFASRQNCQTHPQTHHSPSRCFTAEDQRCAGWHPVLSLASRTPVHLAATVKCVRSFEPA